ncbi:ANTAR domain-containing protein [Streptomyces sp. MS06]|uniref:ANTAR domain-containing protein n=1 Tax=Streptomyces sp. MS06 TaxID=3385974 RepID=UPI00399F1659
MREEKDLIEQNDVLRAEVGQLKHALASHAVVDQAIGVVITLGGLRPEEGWEVLKTVSQRTNVKLRLVAGQVVAWARGGRLPEEVSEVLHERLLLRSAVPGPAVADGRPPVAGTR